MTEKFSFFDSLPDENGQKDREYNAQEFTDYFASLVTTGVMKGAGAELKVTANGSNMITTTDAGIAFIEGRYYANTATLPHTHDTETLGKDRIDRIVVRLDLNTEARYVKSFIKKGVASATPVPPALTRTGTIYEISLAQVKVIGGQTYINASDVVDERGKDDICPWAGSKILPNFNSEGLADLIAKVNNTMNAINAGANTQDPNLVSESYIMTKHPNAPDNVVWWYILTFFYGTRNSSKGQMAISYNGTPKLFIRYFLLGEWEPWVEVTQYLTNWMSLPEGLGWATPSGGFLQTRRVGRAVHLRGHILCSGSPTGVVTTLPAEFRPRGRVYFTANSDGRFFLLNNGSLFAESATNGTTYYFDIVFSANVNA